MGKTRFRPIASNAISSPPHQIARALLLPSERKPRAKLSDKSGKFRRRALLQFGCGTLNPKHFAQKSHLLDQTLAFAQVDSLGPTEIHSFVSELFCDAHKVLFEGGGCA